MTGYEGPQAAIFDLDGVITFTARVHQEAWKELFDSYLREREYRFSEPFRPFDSADYRAYVDGKPRYDGVAAFLGSRGIQLDRGTPMDSPDRTTVCGLGNRKNYLFTAKVQESGVDVDHDAVHFIRELRVRGVHIGLASSSKNAVSILRRAGLLDLFEAIVDGVVSEETGLRGKPDPAIFLTCLRQMNLLDPSRALVAEDAISGVQAAAAGGFGLVLGVDRGDDREQLLNHGAHMVIRSFREVTPEKLADYFRQHARVT
jgi:beta-phosphoglucomutase family hydrolase